MSPADVEDDPNHLASVSAERMKDKTVLGDMVRALLSLGKLSQGEPYHCRTEDDGSVTILRGAGS